MSSYGKCMDFPINLPHYEKMQQNPWYGKNLGNWYSYFSHGMSAFFSHQNPILWYNSSHGKCIIFHNIGKDSRTYRMGKLWEIGFQQYPTKPIKCGKRGKLLLILFPQYWGPFLLDSYPMVCFITCEMDGFHHQTPHSIKKSIKWRRPGNLVPILFR